jgi:hypothetical protein
MALILDRAQLCSALGVSDSTITAWEKKGMPALRKGRGRGMRSLYDFDQVNAWRQHNGYGMPGSPQMLARESSPRSSDVPAPTQPPAAAKVQTSAPARTVTLEQALSQVLGVIFANSLLPAAAMAVHRYRVDPTRALNLFEDMLLVAMFAAAAELRAEDFSVLFSQELEMALREDGRAELVARIEAIAEQYGRDEAGTSAAAVGS